MNRIKQSKRFRTFLEYETGKHDAEFLNPDGARRKSVQVEKDWEGQGLFEWAEAEDQKIRDLAFYKDAREYSSGSRIDFPVQRAKILSRHYRKFSLEGKQPLLDAEGNLKFNPAETGYIFDRVYNGVKKRLGYN